MENGKLFRTTLKRSEVVMIFFHRKSSFGTVGGWRFLYLQMRFSQNNFHHELLPHRRFQLSQFCIDGHKISPVYSIMTDNLTLFRLGFFAPSPPPPLRFLKTIEDIDLKLTPLIKRREINLLLLSYLSCDVT